MDFQYEELPFHIPIPGMFHVTGEHDAGKTSFCLEAGATAKKTCFVDDDIKGRTTITEYQSKFGDFGAYYDLVKVRRETSSQVEFYLAVRDLINNIEPEKYDALIWDTWTEFSKSCRHYVMANPNEFRNPNEWSRKGDIKGAEMNKEAQLLEASIIGSILAKVPSVFLVTHLKACYVNGVRLDGKEVPACSKTIDRVSRFRIWLRHNPNHRAPYGLVLKRLDEKRPTPRGLRTVCILPRKITPNVMLPGEKEKPNDESLWDTIYRYYERPFGNRSPLAEETPNEWELSILDRTLTRDQKHTLRLMLQIEASKGEEEDDSVDDGLRDTINGMVKDGKNFVQIAKVLDLSVAKVAELAQGE